MRRVRLGVRTFRIPMKTKLALVVACIGAVALLAACGKGPEERTCERYMEDFLNIYYTERHPTALTELKELAIEIDQLAQDAAPDVAVAAWKTRTALVAHAAENTRISAVTFEATLDIASDFDKACDNHGYGFDHFHGPPPR